jgi:hypothetical protein
MQTFTESFSLNTALKIISSECFFLKVDFFSFFNAAYFSREKIKIQNHSYVGGLLGMQLHV